MVEVCSPARGSVPRDSHPRPWGRRCGSGDLVLNRPSRAIGIGQCVPAFPFQLSSPFLPPPHSRRAVGDGGESGARDRHAVDWPYRSLFFPSPAPPLLFRPSSQPLRLPLREGARAECPGLNGAGWQREGGEVTGRHALNSPSPRAGWVRRALPHRSPVLGWRGQSRGCQGIHREREKKEALPHLLVDRSGLGFPPFPVDGDSGPAWDQCTPSPLPLSGWMSVLVDGRGLTHLPSPPLLPFPTEGDAAGGRERGEGQDLYLSMVTGGGGGFDTTGPASTLRLAKGGGPSKRTALHPTPHSGGGGIGHCVFRSVGPPNRRGLGGGEREVGGGEGRYNDGDGAVRP